MSASDDREIARLEADLADKQRKADAMWVALQAYVTAQGRMLDRWAEGDDNVKRDLWKALNALEEAGRAALAPHEAAKPAEQITSRPSEEA